MSAQLVGPRGTFLPVGLRATLPAVRPAALLLAFMVALPAAAEVLVPPAAFRSSGAALRPTWRALLFAQLEEGDQGWLPRLQRLPDGSARYVYRRRRGEPPLTVPQIQALLRDPPRWERERAAIATLLGQLQGLGVRVEVTPTRQPSASGEWEPRRAVIRIRPDVPGLGSEIFARVLNHEAIHVAQSCGAGGLRRTPMPLGLPRRLPEEERELLRQPLYAGLPPRVRQLEEEAFAQQRDLGLGPALLRRYCGAVPARPGA
jgi:hypothetical protein